LYALTQKLSVSLCRHHLGHDCLTLGNVATSECGETNLHDGSVVQNLRRDVGLLDGFLHVRHEELITCLVVSGVHGVVVNVHEDSSSSKEWCV
jgi:hypothetical protein